MIFLVTMSQYIPNGVKLKVFVKEQSKFNGKPTNFIEKKKCLKTVPLTGDKAKEFYEELLRTTKTSSQRNSNNKKQVYNNNLKPKVKKKEINFDYNYHKVYKNTDLLIMAQNNDIKSLQSFFEQNTNIEIDIMDDFGWTPLMCASCSGAEEAVGFLLQKGANPDVKDKLGNTPLKLARCKNYRSIVKLLENFDKIKLESRKAREKIKFQPLQPYFCDLCNEKFSVEKAIHETSTVHLFNTKHKTPVFYGIPENNKGFQILLKNGWNKAKGLGPDGKGRMFPVKATMKKSRSGVGAVDSTNNNNSNNNNNNNLGLSSNSKSISKVKKLYSKAKEKNFEKKFRLEFS